MQSAFLDRERALEQAQSVHSLAARSSRVLVVAKPKFGKELGAPESLGTCYERLSATPPPSESPSAFSHTSTGCLAHAQAPRFSLGSRNFYLLTFSSAVHL